MARACSFHVFFHDQLASYGDHMNFVVFFTAVGHSVPPHPVKGRGTHASKERWFELTKLKCLRLLAKLIVVGILAPNPIK